MIHYLRTPENKTVVDIEITQFGTNFLGGGDIRVVVNLVEFSEILLKINPKDRTRIQQCIGDFAVVQELRGEWQKIPLSKITESPDQFVKRRLNEIGASWGLRHVTD